MGQTASGQAQKGGPQNMLQQPEMPADLNQDMPQVTPGFAMQHPKLMQAGKGMGQLALMLAAPKIYGAMQNSQQQPRRGEEYATNPPQRQGGGNAMLPALIKAYLGAG